MKMKWRSSESEKKRFLIVSYMNLKQRRQAVKD